MGIPAPIGVSAAGLPPLGDQANAVVQGVITGVGATRPFAFWGPMNVVIWNTVKTALTTTAASLAATVASGAGLAAGSAINSVNVPPGTTIGVLAGLNVTLALPTLTYPVSGLNTAGNGNVTLPPGSNVSALLDAAVSVPSTAERLTIPADTIVDLIVQADVAPSLNSPGVPGIVHLSQLPTLVPPQSDPLPLAFALVSPAVTVTGADAAANFTDAAAKYDATIQLESSFDGGRTFICCNIGGAGQLAQYLDQSSVRLAFGEPERHVLYRLNCIEYTSGTINWRISATGQAPISLSIPAIS